MSLLKKLPRLLKKSFAKWSDDNAMRMAASLAYYTAFSLAPMLLAAIGIAGLVFGEEAARGQIYEQLRGGLGSSVASAIQELVQAAAKPAQGITGTVVAFVLVLFAASGVFGELKDALNIIWKTQPKTGSGILAWIKGRFFSIGVVLGICFLLLVSLVINAGLSAAESYGSSFLPFAPLVLQVISTLISFGFITVLFALLFKKLPDATVAWRDVWIGSIVTAVLFTLGKTGLEIYIAKASPDSAYGAAGALALVLVWVYYSAQIFLMGAEFTNVYASEEGSRAGETQQSRTPQAAAAPSPVASLPHVQTMPAPVPVSEAVFQAGLDKLPAMLGLQRGKKTKPLRLFGRLTGAALALAAMGLANRKGKRGLRS
jgi:membrane protein